MKTNVQNKGKAQSARKQKQRGNARAVEVTSPPKGSMKMPRGTGLSPCSELYLKALLNPWGEFSELPCVPCTPADMTYRIKTIHRGSFSTGTIGTGFVEWAPMNPTRDVNSIIVSQSTFAAASFVDAGSANTFSAAKTSMPYPNANFSTAGNCLSSRLVASVMKVENTTSPLHRQGSILACRANTGASLPGLGLGPIQGSLENVKVSLIEEKGPYYWGHIPQGEADYDFADSAVNYDTTTPGNRGRLNYGFLVQGASLTNVSTFDYELVEFWEIAGGTSTVTLPNLTRSHADPVGLGRVLESISVPRQSLKLRDQAEFYARNAVLMMAHSDSAAKTVEDLLGLAGLSNGVIGGLAKGLVSLILT